MNLEHPIDRDAPNRKIIAIDQANPKPEAWKTVVREGTGDGRSGRER